MYIDRKNKKLGIIRNLSYKQWNVDVDFVKIGFFYQIDTGNSDKKKLCTLIVLSHNIYYNMSIRQSRIVWRTYLKYFTSRIIRVFIQNDMSKIPEILTENCCSQGTDFQMTLETITSPVTPHFYFFNKLLIA